MLSFLETEIQTPRNHDPNPLDGHILVVDWEIMKTHTLIGHRILSRVATPLMQMAADIALCHHEKWDGTGYPRSLRGEEIPLEARIVAICDVYDALTSDRPYKRPWTSDAAASQIREQSGRHFQPSLVDAFMGILPRIRNIRKMHDDPTLNQTEPAL